jgi:hypothetical protein
MADMVMKLLEIETPKKDFVKSDKRFQAGKKIRETLKSLTPVNEE